jgi:EasF-like predicted methyltransferase
LAFPQITYLDEYYLTNCEIDVLRRYATDMASKIPDGAVVVELGSGNLRKVCLLLQAFENAGKTIDYYALDLSQEELQRTLSQVPHFKHVSCHGLFGTYDDGRDWLAGMKDDRPRCILHMGSSIGNFTQAEAVDFLKQFSDVMKPQDLILIGVDSWNQPDKVYHAYNDSQGLTHKFILNGLANANRIFNREIFHLPDWRVHGEYVYDSDEGGRHQAFVFPIRDVTVLGQRVHAFERIKIEQSIKYSELGSEKLFSLAGLEKLARWTVDNEYGELGKRCQCSCSCIKLHDTSHSPLPAKTKTPAFASHSALL